MNKPVKPSDKPHRADLICGSLANERVPVVQTFATSDSRPPSPSSASPGYSLHPTPPAPYHSYWQSVSRHSNHVVVYLAPRSLFGRDDVKRWGCRGCYGDDECWRERNSATPGIHLHPTTPSVTSVWPPYYSHRRPHSESYTLTESSLTPATLLLGCDGCDPASHVGLQTLSIFHVDERKGLPVSSGFSDIFRYLQQRNIKLINQHTSLTNIQHFDAVDILTRPSENKIYHVFERLPPNYPLPKGLF